METETRRKTLREREDPHGLILNPSERRGNGICSQYHRTEPSWVTGSGTVGE